MDLKSFREDKLKIKNQSEFAKLLGVNTSQISMWEENPGSITFDVVQSILVKTNVSYEELTNWKKPAVEPLYIKNTWKNVNFTKNSITEYMSSALESSAIIGEQKEKYIQGLRSGVLKNASKPQVTIVGRSDTGKSTIINALLGVEKMPTSWTPTTSIAVYIKHIDDRPDFIEDDVWVFSNQLGDETLWNERLLYDEDYCLKWKIGAGDAEILKSYGTRQGENYDKQAGSAVMFIDAPILATCDIVDLPGFGTETESDDDITFKAAQRADVIIYLSQANGFMRIEDITYLKRNITELPVWEKAGKNKLKPLANLFVVASQSHTVNHGNRAQLTEILDVGCKNLLKTLPDEYWTNRKGASGYDYAGYGKHELRDRFYTYTTDIPELSEKFNNSLKEILEVLPEIINKQTKEFVREYIKNQKPNLENELRKYELMAYEIDKVVELLSEINANELPRIQDNDKHKNDFIKLVKELEHQSISEVTTYISNTINTDNIMQLMKSRGVKNKKDDVEQFGSYLQTLIQLHCENALDTKSKILEQKTKDYIKGFADSINQPYKKYGIDGDFDAGWAFTTALSKLTLLGGLGVFAYSIGSWAMLGLSLSTSVIAGAMTASALGPIGIGVGLILVAGLGIMKLFGGGWEKNVAKKIVSAFEENNVNEEYRNSIREYWAQTETAFNMAAQGLENEWLKYVVDLEESVSGYDINDINRKIRSLKNVSDFFDNIPL